MGNIVMDLTLFKGHLWWCHFISDNVIYSFLTWLWPTGVKVCIEPTKKWVFWFMFSILNSTIMEGCQKYQCNSLSVEWLHISCHQEVWFHRLYASTDEKRATILTNLSFPLILLWSAEQNTIESENLIVRNQESHWLESLESQKVWYSVTQIHLGTCQLNLI